TPEARQSAMLRRYLGEPKPVVWGDAFAPAPGERPEDALSRCYGALLAWRDARYAALAHVVIDGAALEASDPGVEGFLARAHAGGEGHGEAGRAPTGARAGERARGPSSSSLADSFDSGFGLAIGRRPRRERPAATWLEITRRRPSEAPSFVAT